MVKDPYQYFRLEARELLDGLGRGVLKLESDPTAEQAASLLRFAHTLKGAARVVKQSGIAEKAHAIEDLLAPLRDSGTGLAPGSIDRVLALLDGMVGELKALDAPAPAVATPETTVASTLTPANGAAAATAAAEVPAPPRADAPAPGENIAEMDALLDGLSELRAQLRGVRQVAASAGRARQMTRALLEKAGEGAPGAGGPFAPAAPTSRSLRSMTQEIQDLVAGVERNLGASLDDVERQLHQVQGLAERLRLLPAGMLFGALERTARDAAHALGKEVSFQARGAEVRIDAHVLEAIQGALVQVVRNAVAHGIEDPSQRAASGKAAAGRIDVDVTLRGDRVVFVCGDDGRGIDVEAVRRAARARGAILPDQPLDADAALSLLLRGGLTTSTRVTEVSGRGIGLDVVRETCARLGGEVRSRSHAGIGTTFELVVPVSVSALEAIVVEAAGASVAIPLSAVARAVRFTADEITRTGRGDSVACDGQMVPFVSLSDLLQRRPRPSGAGPWTALVINAGEHRAAIAVDRLAGSMTLVVRRLPPRTPADPIVAGAALDGEGNPQLVLDPEQLVRAAQPLERGARPEPARAPAPILVVDDSLTTRMMEQSILESAGYEVDLATSAEEAIDKARGRRYQLFLVDVEMPGMDGFTFVERTRADPTLSEIPAILVTSRNAAGDRERGAAAGARGYVVKSEFDQVALLELIRSLVSAP